MGILLCMATTLHAQVNFTEVDLEPNGLGNGPNGQYYDLGDYDRDGYIDILTTRINGGANIYTYDEVDTNFVTQNLGMANRAKFADFDNNNTLDVISTETNAARINLSLTSTGRR